MVLTVFSREHSLVVDGLLCEGHDVIDVLRGGDAGLLTALVVPGVRPAARARHVGTRGGRAELGHRAVQQVHMVE